MKVGEGVHMGILNHSDSSSSLPHHIKESVGHSTTKRNKCGEEFIEGAQFFVLNGI